MRVVRLPELRDELGARRRIGEALVVVALLARQQVPHRSVGPVSPASSVCFVESALNARYDVASDPVSAGVCARLGRGPCLLVAHRLARVVERGDDPLRVERRIERRVGLVRQIRLEPRARLVGAAERREARAAIEREARRELGPVRLVARLLRLGLERCRASRARSRSWRDRNCSLAFKKSEGRVAAKAETADAKNTAATSRADGAGNRRMRHLPYADGASDCGSCATSLSRIPDSRAYAHGSPKKRGRPKPPPETPNRNRSTRR